MVNNNYITKIQKCLQGSCVALITPFDENGNINNKELEKLIQYHIDSGTSSIVIAGTTGESSVLSKKEHIKLIKDSINISNKRIPIIAGVGSNNTSNAIELTKELIGSGVYATLSVAPYYNKPTQNGLYLHYKAISECSDIPLILYNVPGRTSSDISVDTCIKLSYLPNIVGIKEASGDINRIKQIKENAHKDFIIVSGDDINAIESIKLGAQGVISVTANIAAQEVSKAIKLALEGNFVDSLKLDSQLKELHEVLFIESNPIPVKWAAKKLGLIKDNNHRLPMTKLEHKNEELITKILTNINLLN